MDPSTSTHSKVDPSSSSTTPSISHLFIDSIMKAALHPSDMEIIQQKQAEAFKTMRQTNEDLQRINSKCTNELPNIQKDFQIHQFMLKEMKSDLEFITKALADMRRKLGIKEPERKDDEVDLDDEVLTYSPVAPSKVQHVNAESLQEHDSDYLEGDDLMHYVN
ncbi:hypothetical protein FDP41_011591 [Naegleria fowleri]|uniref:KxDL domain-containing protein n=1 Tax=Naegleria fowleri TaxID=5763 RepID=A0A6A5C6F0_NAEFO|nr:uncharacterized protein FDP41_011591 [Naegleria fowleri]KAF0982661.1 hypothetical protein FDP41_011591 [Naegleria fowleri]CAG4718623.1 unnamed protein product [Naegleria fowleri]